MTENATQRPDEPASARLSPLHDVHVAAGATFTDFAGWRMPVRYSSDLAEHHAVRTAAGLFDLSHMAEIVVVGPEASRALDWALAGAISRMAEGQAKYTLLLEEGGGILDDLVVYRTGPDRFLIVANAANREVVAAEVLARTAPFECEALDESDDIALLAVQGPIAADMLANLDPVLEADLASLRNYRAVPGRFDDHEVLVARTGYTGEDGFELYLSPDAAPRLWRAIAEAGAGSGLLPAGLAARDTLRLEAGMPLYGHELTREVLPAQAGLARVVKRDDDFVGSAAIARGPAPDAPVLVGLAGEGRRAARSGYPVLGDGGARVGEITSGALSPTLGRPIAMAYVRPEASPVGTVLAVDVRGSVLPMTVVELPFYRRAR